MRNENWTEMRDDWIHASWGNFVDGDFRSI
jgi:hypothetical protein